MTGPNASVSPLSQAGIYVQQPPPASATSTVHYAMTQPVSAASRLGHGGEVANDDMMHAAWVQFALRISYTSHSVWLWCTPCVRTAGWARWLVSGWNRRRHASHRVLSEPLLV